jgi:hypothetical protein
MKTIFLPLMITLLTLVMYSCSKDKAASVSLVGNWSVVNDSSLNTNKLYTLPAGDSGIASSNYIGEQCAATLNFDSSSNLVSSFYNCNFDFPTVDLATYVATNNQATISIYSHNYNCCSYTNLNPVIKRVYTVSNLSVHSATLTYSPLIGDPVSSMKPTEIEVINLKK